MASKVQKEILEHDAALREIVERLVRAYQPESVYLFGSKARGDYGPDSDYDLLVVVPDDAPPARRRSRLAYEALRGTGTAVDALVCTRSYFEARRYLKASLPGTVLREGRLLYAGRAGTQGRHRGLVAQGKGRSPGGQTTA
jgi:predicted nucleotidyltransferase